MGAIQQALMMASAAAAGPPHRYWRLTSFATPSGNEIIFYELQLWTDSGTRADSSGTTITASQADAFGNPLSRLVDGNDSSNQVDFFPALGSGYIKWDFGIGVTKYVGGFKWSTNGVAAQTTTGFSLEYSDDDAAWTAAGAVSGLAVFTGGLTAFIPFV